MMRAERTKRVLNTTYTKPSQLLDGAGTFGKVWSACRQREIEIHRMKNE
jgi:hypothetical protein